MDISGPCFCPIKDGRPFNKYEIVCRETVPKGIESTKYYFNTEEEAETYLLFLLQQDGLKEIDKVLSSKRSYKWEKLEYIKFRDSIDWEELPRKIKNMDIITEHVFVEIRMKQ